jgi:hypothetical protein
MPLHVRDELDFTVVKMIEETGEREPGKVDLVRSHGALQRSLAG